MTGVDRPRRMTLEAFKSFRKGGSSSLIGFATVRLPIGLLIADCPICTSRGKTLRLPSITKPQLDRRGPARRARRQKTIRRNCLHLVLTAPTAESLVRCRRSALSASATPRGLHTGGGMTPLEQALPECAKAAPIFPCVEIRGPSQKRPRTPRGFHDASRNPGHHQAMGGNCGPDAVDWHADGACFWPLGIRHRR